MATNDTFLMFWGAILLSIILLVLITEVAHAYKVKKLTNAIDMLTKLEEAKNDK